MASLRCSHLGKTFGDGTVALHDLDLEVEDGELLVVVGPSGCGKSTLLRLLAGLETPGTGTLELDGRRVDALAPRERNVAMVFQDYALYGHLSVRGNLDFPLRMAKVPRDERARRVERVAAVLELEDLLDRRPAELSGGQQQRVAMGRALVREPALLLLDEPFSNLDARLRLHLRTELAALQRRLGTTTLHVTHDQAEALSLGHRVAVLRAGRLQQLDAPAALYERPATTFVAAFVGSPGMGLFPARVVGDGGGGPALRIGAGRLPLPECGPARHRGALPADRPLVGGLRAEALSLAGDDDGRPRFSGRVVTLQHHGHERLVGVVADGVGADEAERAALAAVADADGAMADGRPVLTARLPASVPVQLGQSLSLAVDLARLHLFSLDGVALP